MKIMFRVDKYVFEIAGRACIGPYGYYTPYKVWRRLWFLPFIYKFFGFCQWNVVDREEDIVKWIEYVKNKKKNKEM